MGGKSKRHRKQQKSKARSLEAAAVSSDDTLYFKYLCIFLLYFYFLVLWLSGLQIFYNVCLFW